MFDGLKKWLSNLKKSKSKQPVLKPLPRIPKTFNEQSWKTFCDEGIRLQQQIAQANKAIKNADLVLQPKESWFARWFSKPVTPEAKKQAEDAKKIAITAKEMAEKSYLQHWLEQQKFLALDHRVTLTEWNNFHEKGERLKQKISLAEENEKKDAIMMYHQHLIIWGKLLAQEENGFQWNYLHAAFILSGQMIMYKLEQTHYLLLLEIKLNQDFKRDPLNYIVESGRFPPRETMASTVKAVETQAPSAFDPVVTVTVEKPTSAVSRSAACSISRKSIAPTVVDSDSDSDEEELDLDLHDFVRRSSASRLPESERRRSSSGSSREWKGVETAKKYEEIYITHSGHCGQKVAPPPDEQPGKHWLRPRKQGHT